MQITEFGTTLVIGSASNVILFNPSSGASMSTTVPPPAVPPNLTPGQLEVLNREERSISAIAMSVDEKLIAVATENKQIVIFDTDLKIIKQFIVNRTASKVLFTRSGDLIVADRTGDVFLYKACNEKEPILLLGHLSMILDMVLTPCEKYIITCDRDEKIRVSHFPNTYNIASFCLGHEEFVICIKVIGERLVSGSGDGSIRVWDYVQGKELCRIDTSNSVTNQIGAKEFFDLMDKEKVVANILPIKDMQALEKNHHLFVGVSLYNLREIQLYMINPHQNFEWTVQIIGAVPEIHKFFLRSHQLYTFGSGSLKIHSCINDEWRLLPISSVQDFCTKHAELLTMDDNSITVLYKRKFDNVREYLNRKKLRLESRK